MQPAVIASLAGLVVVDRGHEDGRDRRSGGVHGACAARYRKCRRDGISSSSREAGAASRHFPQESFGRRIALDPVAVDAQQPLDASQHARVVFHHRHDDRLCSHTSPEMSNCGATSRTRDHCAKVARILLPFSGQSTRGRKARKSTSPACRAARRSPPPPPATALFELLHHRMPMRLDGALGGAEIACDLLVHLAAHDQYEHLAFARREAMQKRARHLELSPVAPPPLLRMLRKRALHGAEQIVLRGTGFDNTSSAPALIARTLIGMSPCPVRNTIGRMLSIATSRLCRSRPSKPGNCRSSRMQPGPSPAWLVEDIAAPIRTEATLMAGRRQKPRHRIAKGGIVVDHMNDASTVPSCGRLSTAAIRNGTRRRRPAGSRPRCGRRNSRRWCARSTARDLCPAAWW